MHMYTKTQMIMFYTALVWVLEGQIDDINVINFGKCHTKNKPFHD